jgi:DNA-directed RNA polymerase sigma subunit (sigma70/sigma32)
MPTPNDKVILVMREIRRRRSAGLIGETDEVTPYQMAAISAEIGTPVSERTFRRIESDAIQKLRHHPLARLALLSFLKTEN